jgi:hypothetical protein
MVATCPVSSEAANHLSGFSRIFATREAFPDYGKQAVNPCAFFLNGGCRRAIFAGYEVNCVSSPLYQSQVAYWNKKKKRQPFADFTFVLEDDFCFSSIVSSTSSASMIAMESNERSNAVSSDSSCALMMKEKSIRLLTTSRSAMVAPTIALDVAVFANIKGW